MPAPKIDQAEIDRRFDLHRPREAHEAKACDVLRDVFKGAAVQLVVRTPNNREQALALTHLEQALYYGIAAIVRPTPTHELPPPEKLTPAV